MNQHRVVDHAATSSLLREHERAREASEKPFRLVVADDHAMFRDGLRALLAQLPDVRIVAEVERADDLRSALNESNCDIVLLDLQMDRWMMTEIEWMSRIATVAVLSPSANLEDALSAMKLGARAVVQKRLAFQTLVEALRTLAAGGAWMPAELQMEIVTRLHTPASKSLTDRESEIVRCVASGLRNAEIARRLSIAEATVKTHLNNIFQKMGLRDRAGLMRYSLRSGLVAIGDTDI